MPIVLNLDVELAKRKLSVAELAALIDITPANLHVLKSGRAKAVRFTTLDAICRVLECQPGDILAFEPAVEEQPPPPPARPSIPR